MKIIATLPSLRGVSQASTSPNPAFGSKPKKIPPTLPSESPYSDHIQRPDVTKYLEGMRATQRTAPQIPLSVSLGRNKENRLHLNHEAVSRDHAVIELKDGTFSIQDLGSTNGTLVDFDNIHGRSEPTKLEKSEAL